MHISMIKLNAMKVFTAKLLPLGVNISRVRWDDQYFHRVYSNF